MKYCMKCGVSIDEEKNRVCPLCHTIILSDEEIKKLSLDEINIEQEVKKVKKVKVNKDMNIKTGVIPLIMLLASFISIFSLVVIDLASGFNIEWSLIPIISVILFILTVCLPFMKFKKTIYWYITYDTIVLCVYFLSLNYIITKEIAWSYYVVLAIILVWVYLSSIFINKIKGFVLNIAIDFIATSIFVLLVTLGLDASSGFSRLALPINGLVFILTVITYLFIKTYRYNWRVIISTISINVSILCLGIDLLIQRYVNHQLYLKWSYIVLFVLIPVTLLMMYLDNRYKVNKYIIRKFHI
ncbi:hypothetical protein KHQ81_01125 [Mycoplasmatota bacterium]|nr:hypothetical protein KHQ81_01125 [Mycoplasmatota bacterium]